MKGEADISKFVPLEVYSKIQDATPFSGLKKMKKLLIAITLMMLFLHATAHSQTKALFPSGWRAAEKSDYSAEDLSFINNRVPNHVEADFNGDGINDNAWILVNEAENKYGLFIFLGKKGGSYKIIKLSEYQKETDKLYMGISLIEPGKHQTACGKGYWDCAQDEPKVLTLRNPGINFFKFESANSVFYWNSIKKEFKRIWLSD